MNLKLRYAIDKARQVSMPKDNIERAIKRGTGDLEGQQFEEITYEGYGPGGVAILVDVLTDNRNRTSGEVRKTFERAGGHMGSAGCVGYLFERKGVFSVPAEATDEDTLMGIVLDAGADDLKRAGSTFDITCDPVAFTKVQEALQKNNVPVAHSEITQLGKVPVDTDLETAKKVMRLLEALDDHDDVQNVYSNFNMTEAVLAEMEKG
jgi:YebC/PmpR family DNA-binding regulatory protein